MQFKLLNGYVIDISLDKYLTAEIDYDNFSELQRLTGELLEKRYPCDIIISEFKIPQANGLELDWYIPRAKIAVEVQGRQHQEFVPFFHKNIYGFRRQKRNDILTKQFCELNNIKLYLVYTEKDLEKI